MQESTRKSARKRLKEGQQISAYERQLLGDELVVRPSPPPPPPPPPSPPSPRELVAKALSPAGIRFRTPFLQSLNQHATDLAVTHEVTIQRIHDDVRGAALSEEWVIECSAVTNEETYAIFLHELGHLIDPDGDSSQYRYVLKEGFVTGRKSQIAAGGEIGAWRFAVRTALQWTREMHQTMYESLASYRSYGTSDERFEMASLLSQSAVKVRDRPLTFGELDEQKERVREA